MTASSICFNTYPSIPAATRSKTRSSTSVPVNIMILICGSDLRSASAISCPSISGMTRSTRTISGFRLFAASKPFRPFAASPTISKSGSRRSTIASPLRTTAWSSTINMRNLTALPLCNCLLQSLHIFHNASISAEDGAPRNEDSCTCLYDFSGVAGFDPAVHFEPGFGVDRIQHGAQAFDFGGAGWDVTLPTETRVDRHDQREINIGQNFFYCNKRCRRVKGDARLGSQFSDALNRAMQMNAGFHLHSHNIRARVDEICKKAIWLFDHQMHVKQRASLFAQRSQCLNDERTNGDVGDEVTIHDVNM